MGTRPQRAAGRRRGAALVLGLLLIPLSTGAASAPAATVSGAVRSATGDPVPGVVVTVSTRFDPVASATTGLDGSYSLTVSSGSYQLSAALPEGTDPIPGLPAQWSIGGSLSVPGDVTANATLPAVRTLIVRVLDSTDVPQEGFTVSLPGFRAPTAEDAGLQAFSSVPDAVTDAAGEVSGLVFDGSRPAGFTGTGSLTPPEGSGFLPSTFGVGRISGDTTLVVHAAEPSTHLTGVVRDADGDPVAGVALSLGPASDVTDASGAYSLGVEPGGYTLSGGMSEGGNALGLPEQWFFSGSLDVTADRTLDLRLPATATLIVRVLDGEHGDAPIEGAAVDLPNFEAIEGFDLGAGSDWSLTGFSPAGATDAAGEAHALAFDDARAHFGQPVTVTPPESAGYAPVESTLPHVEGDTTVVVRAPVPFYWVAGTIAEGDGAPLVGVSVDDGFDTTTTAADGTYRLKAQPGTSGLDLAMPSADPPNLPANWTLTGRFTALADRTLDVAMPKTLRVTTRILGDEDEPVPGAQISIPGFSFWIPLDTMGDVSDVQVRADPVTLTTDANGEAFYAEFDDTQPTFGVAARVTPPADSGYDLLLFAPSFNRFDLLDVEHVHDSHAPAIAYAQSPDGANGWWTGRPASVHVTASDPRSDTLLCTVDGVSPRRGASATGPDTLEADLTISDEGRHAVSCTATDRSGNATIEATTALIDLTNPAAPSLAADRAPDFSGVTGDWWADSVTVTAGDNGDPLLADGSAGSGVDLASVPAPQTFATSGRHVAGATVTDLAGNVSRAARLTARVDANPPTSLLACPAGTIALGARANATWSDDDSESGLVGANHGRVALDTSTAGTFTADHAATDRVGHATTSSCTYTVS